MAEETSNKERVKARVSDWRFKTVKVEGEDRDIVEIGFDVDERPDLPQTIWWTGWLTDGPSMDKVGRVLVTCGFDDTNLAKFSEGIEGGALDKGRVVSIRLGLNKRGDTIAKFVDPLVPNKAQSAMDKKALRDRAKNVSMKAAVMAAKGEIGSKVQNAPKMDTEEGLPF